MVVGVDPVDLAVVVVDHTLVVCGRFAVVGLGGALVLAVDAIHFAVVVSHDLAVVGFHPPLVLAVDAIYLTVVSVNLPLGLGLRATLGRLHLAIESSRIESGGHGCRSVLLA